MNIFILISSVAILTGVLSLAFSISRRKKLKGLRGLVEFTQKQIDELLDSQMRSRESLEGTNRRINDQSRRIAWLETRLRQPKLASDEVLDESVLTEPVKPNMTERRHRVITLASRGQKAESIAAALGLLTGEVELIINLNQAALRNK